MFWKIISGVALLGVGYIVGKGVGKKESGHEDVIVEVKDKEGATEPKSQDDVVVEKSGG